MAKSALSILVTWGALTLGTSLLGACGGMGTSEGHARADNGYSTVQDGVSRTRAGLAQYLAGSTPAGMAAMSDGVHRVESGAGAIHSGLGMMPGSMMGDSCAAMGAQTMSLMDTGAGRMGEALTKLGGSRADDQASGMAMMRDAMQTVERGLQQMDAAMSCMNQCGSTMGGSMP